MQPTPGLKNTLRYYPYISWMYPMLRFFFPKFVSSLSELGLAMIQAVAIEKDENILEVEDIVALAKIKHE